MTITRRQFVAMGGIVSVGGAIPALFGRGSATAGSSTEFHAMTMKQMATMPGMNGAATSTLSPAVFVKSRPLAKFVQPLRGVFPLDPGGIPVAIPDGVVRYLKGKVVAKHYTFDIAEYTDRLHPAMAETTLWGYHCTTNLGGSPPQRHLGGIIIAEKNVPIQLTFRNRLPRQHVLPVDPTIMGAELAQNRACVHFHGGKVPWISDGVPLAWFRPDDDPTDVSPLYGPSAANATSNIYKRLNPTLKSGEAEYYYPNAQSARFGWYHDHAMGITRLNAYAGIASALIIRDNFERSLVSALGLPDFIENGGREIPLIIQDKIFQDEEQDPTYPGRTATGSLWYPYRYTDRWAAIEGSDAADLPISAIPEMFGDTMLVNGVVHPILTVEPRRYRLRVLNATQARFLNLQMYELTTRSDGSQIPDFSKAGPDYLVIGTEGGFLARAVRVPSGQRLTVTVDPTNGDRSVDPANPGGSLITAPAERWDLVVDFSAYAGKSLVVFNDTPAPFPGGDSLNDGDIDVDPNGNEVLINQLIMKIDVASAITGPADPPLGITDGFPLASNRASGIDRALASSWATVTTNPLPSPRDISRTRKLTLNELFDDHGRLIQMLGTNMLGNPAPGFTIDPAAPGANINKTTAKAYMDPVTENPRVDDTEVWEIANLTADVHPMHFHLVNVQVLGRRPFTGYSFNAAGVGAPTGLGVERGPDSTELGWKDTVRMNPGEVTRVAMKFNLTPVPFAVPASPRTGGNEYVWHCHILEHEEHDMMRPLIVRGSNPRLT